MQPARKLKFAFYALRASSDREAVAQAIAKIKADPEAFVLGAEPAEKDDRTIIERLIFGDR